MEQKEYEDYLVGRVKELLNSQTEADIEDQDKDFDKPEMRKKRNKMDEKVEKEQNSEIPVPWDPQEIEHLSRNRSKMDNNELREFLEKDSELQEQLVKRDWKQFSRWEERLIIQRHQTMTPEEIADEMDRKKRVVELKMRAMGIKPGES